MTYAIPYHFRMLMQGYITERGGDWDAIDPAVVQRIYDEAEELAGTVGMFKTMDGPHPSQQHVVAELDTILSEQANA